jgi:hypothetical protein
MRVVEIRVAVAGFGHILGAMRDWLDRNGGDPVKFETARESDDVIRIRVEFGRAELAEGFQREFGAAASNLTRAA